MKIKISNILKMILYDIVIHSIVIILVEWLKHLL